MILRAVIRGANLDELNTNAQAVCQQFYGAEPYEIVVQQWTAATAEKFDTNGTVTGFMMDMEARPVPAT